MSTMTTSPHQALPDMAQWVYHTAAPKSSVDLIALSCVLAASLAYLLHGIAWDKPDPYNQLFFERPQLKDGSAARSKHQNRDIANAMEELKKNVVVFWGSQSGVAEGFASRLAKELHLRFGLNTMTADLSDYDAETIAQIPESTIAFFVMSTYGEGDPSDNAQSFWEWIKKSHEVRLSNLRYAAFGLGNRNYKHYNRVIDVVASAMDRMGAKALLPVGKADDAQGATEEDFMLWKEDLFTTLRTTLGVEEQPMRHEASLDIVQDPSLDLIDLHDGAPIHTPAPKALPVTVFQELFRGSIRNCLHMELDLSDTPEARYKTGDHLGVWPMNPEKEVSSLISALDLSTQQNAPVILRSLESSTKIKLPSPTTIVALFRHYLEICAPPSRDVIQGLAQFAPNADAKSILLDLAGSKEVHARFVARKQLTFGRLLRLAGADATWTALPLSFVVESIPPMQPRYYSISSSSVLSPRRIAITALVANTALPDAPEEAIQGVTTNYMLALAQSQGEAGGMTDVKTSTYQLPALKTSSPVSMFVHVRKSKFKLPMTSTCPLIMVAAGTGLAPFRAFVAERTKLHTIGKPVGKMLLFFGCRDPNEDYIYREEMEEAQKKLGNGIFEIVTAFSRMKAEPKVYVQDRVAENVDQLAEMVFNQGANLYICGRASMAREVGQKFSKLLSSSRNMSETEADGFVSGMRRRSKWQEDVWG